MAKKKTKKKIAPKKKTKQKSRTKKSTKVSFKSKLSGEVEGLLLLALGTLTLVSLSARIVQGEENLLGQYFGVLLSDMLTSFAGPVPSIIIPFILFAVGWRVFRGVKATTSIRKIVFFSILFIELCAFLSINVVRIVPNAGMFLGGGGYIGSFIADDLFIPLFGHKVFGPYFVTFTGILITVVWGARLNLNHFIDLFEGTKELFLNFSEVLNLHWSPNYDGDTVVKKEKRGKNYKDDEIIKEEEKERQINERKRLEEKQKEFISEKSGIDPQIVGTTDVPQIEDVQEKESVAEKRQRLQMELDAKNMEESNVQEADINEQSTPKEQVSDEINNVSEIGNQEEPAVSDLSTKSIPIIAGVKEEEKQKIKYEPYNFPPLDLLHKPPPISDSVSKEDLLANSKILEEKLNDFGVQGKVINVYPGPIITRYEIQLAPGIKVSKVTNLSDDLAMAMKAVRIRILAPIPGRAAIGIELPNPKPSTIFLREVMASDKFTDSKQNLTMVLGKTITGDPYTADLTKMPHLLVAGQTGSGKSVCINCLINSFLYKMSPEDCRLLLIDPKVVELALYNDVPHLFAPVVTDPKEAVKCLRWAVIEMERRYKMLAKVAVRNIVGFNEKIKSGQIKEDVLTEEENKKLPYIVIIIDELADLMMTAANEVETSIVRIAQLARAVGIHLIVATQRPTANVLTGLIKANMPSRISFRVASKLDSRVVLDQNGSEALLGNGDMLFVPPGVSEVLRLHGAFISDSETEAIVDYVKNQKVEAERLSDWGVAEEVAVENDSRGGATSSMPTDADLFVEAARLIVNHQIGSTSLIQRRLKVGYARAGRLMDDLEAAGIVGKGNGSKPRDVMIDEIELDGILAARKKS